MMCLHGPVTTWQNLMTNPDEDKVTVDDSGCTINYVYQRPEYPMHSRFSKTQFFTRYDWTLQVKVLSSGYLIISNKYFF